MCIRDRSILESLDPAFFDRLPMGLSHEDFTPDNMLFDDNGVAAILDFDRNQYGYLWHDVGRALLSFTLEEGGLAMEKARAFLEGYAQAKEAPGLADALRLVWCLEFPWLSLIHICVEAGGGEVLHKLGPELLHLLG